jgi:hypothetical protein
MHGRANTPIFVQFSFKVADSIIIKLHCLVVTIIMMILVSNCIIVSSTCFDNSNLREIPRYGA